MKSYILKKGEQYCRTIFILFYLFRASNLCAQVSSVNYSTGSLDVTVPIYTLQEGNLSVPISLSYDGSGVLVESVASNVGLNWQLNAGGYISREVRGLPDESTLSNATPPGYSTSGYPQNNSFGLFKDYEPDIFSLVLNGSVTRFMIKPGTNNSEVLLLNDNTDLKIEVVNTGNTCDTYCVPLEKALCYSSRRLGQFIVTTPDGIRYYFGTDATHREYILSVNALADYQTGAFGYNGLENISSASTRPVKWHLSSIENPKGSKGASGGFSVAPFQKITFEYTRSLQRMESATYDKEFAPTSAICDDIPFKNNIENDVLFLYKSDPKSIESDNVIVYFNHSGLANINRPLPKNTKAVIQSFPDTSINFVNPFNDYNRKDIPEVDLTSDQAYYIACTSSGAKIEKTKALNHILVVDKTVNGNPPSIFESDGVTGFFLYHLYFNEYIYKLYNKNAFEVEERRTRVVDRRLSLAGVYPIKFNDTAVIEVLPVFETSSWLFLI